MQTELNRFLHYLQVEKGYSQGTIKAYQLDIGRGLIPFLHQQGKFWVQKVTKNDIRAYMEYLAVQAEALLRYRRGRPQAQNGRLFVGTRGQSLGRAYVYEIVRRYLKLAGIIKDKQD